MIYLSLWLDYKYLSHAVFYIRISAALEKSGTINVVTFAAANLLCTNQTWGRANEVSDFPREVSDNWGHAILSWAIPSNGQAPGRETPFSGDLSADSDRKKQLVKLGKSLSETRSSQLVVL